MPDVRIEYWEYEGDNCTICDDGDTAGHVVHASDEELAEWRRVIAEYDRVQAVMRERYIAAQSAYIAAMPPREPQPLPEGAVVSSITMADVYEDLLPGLLAKLPAALALSAGHRSQSASPAVGLPPQIEDRGGDAVGHVAEHGIP
jgi:hypothetical protein